MRLLDHRASQMLTKMKTRGHGKKAGVAQEVEDRADAVAVLAAGVKLQVPGMSVVDPEEAAALATIMEDGEAGGGAGGGEGQVAGEARVADTTRGRGLLPGCSKFVVFLIVLILHAYVA